MLLSHQNLGQHLLGPYVIGIHADRLVQQRLGLVELPAQVE
jgi:hypothetical protein